MTDNASDDRLDRSPVLLPENSSTRPTEVMTARKTHFGFAGAREMLFDEPLGCPAYGALSFDGLAVDDDDRLHLVVRARDVRFYLGPDRSDVVRRIEIVTAALVKSGEVRVDRVPEIAAWLWECRLSAVDEIVAASQQLQQPHRPERICPGPQKSA